jgi:twitching motility protein PilT
MEPFELLELMHERQASDLHLKVGAPPVLRIHGELAPIPDAPVTDRTAIEAAFAHLASDDLRQQFQSQLELDFSFELPGRARFRINASRQQGELSLAIRRISLAIPALEELGLPAICATLALKRRGLILVTGPTGSGKSTTLAAMIDHLNRRQARRIITIEDPIEYHYQDQRSFITQRELGRDTRSFAIATKYALRQDPDVILVGEMRDPDTIAACLTAAETGHLVMSTLHTNSCPQTIDRIVDSFAPHQQGQIRMQLSLTLEAVLAQTLLPRLGGDGRVAAVEVMLLNPAVRNLIREGKTHQIMNVIQTGAQSGMQTLEHSLRSLADQGLIDRQMALEYALDPDSLRALWGDA